MQEVNLFAVYTDILNEKGIPYFITGSVASIVYGEPRLTHDIDLVINITSDQVENFIKAFPLTGFYCPPAEIILIELKRSYRGHFNLIHHETGFKADIYLTGKDPFQMWAFENRRPIKFDGFTIYVAPPEYVIIRKLEYYKEGKSSKHLSDIKGMLANSNEMINQELLHNTINKFGLAEIWQLVQRVDI